MFRNFLCFISVSAHHQNTGVVLICLVLQLLASGRLLADEEEETVSPAISPSAAQATWSYPENFAFELWADQSLVANPAAISFDEAGRLFVAEHFRNRKGTEDDRMHPYWMDDDFAIRTVDDRLAMYRKWAAAGKKPMSFYTEHADRIRIVSDSDGDGVADRSVTYAEFGEVLDGALVGLLARPDGIWVTNIPHLWKLTGSRDDGMAAEKEQVLTGFGVKVSLHGHDLHGIIEGPDGRFYWSIGDRGYHVKSKEGNLFHDAYAGAVFRCERDGSDFQVFATGLRNPQELAFDEFGNLFTVDNDADGDDRARVLYLVEGADYGWRMSYQWQDQHKISWAPFVERTWWREGLWENKAGRSPTVLPAIGHLTEGPCGLVRIPELSTFPDESRGAFLIVDFRGAAIKSNLWQFKVDRRGAGFQMVDSKPLISGMMPTDIEFGADGALYIADWIEGWSGDGIGRIWKMSCAVEKQREAKLAKAQKLMQQPTGEWSDELLAELLGHVDGRIRLKAQFAVVDRPEWITMLQAIAQSGNRMARLHSLRALGQIQRSAHNQTAASVLAPVANLLGDPDEEIRVAVARLLRDTPMEKMLEPLKQCLADPSPRVRFFATLALGRSGSPNTISAISELIITDSEVDEWIQHAAVMALTEIAAEHRQEVMQLASHDHPQVRLVALQVASRMETQQVASFLHDPDPRLVLEAARAINDGPIPEMLPNLAALISNEEAINDVDLALRVLNANFRLGEPSHASRVATVAANANAPELIRREALSLLAEWPVPSPRERIAGTWQPLPLRSSAAAAKEAARVVPELVRDRSTAVRKAAVALAQHYEINQATDSLLELAADSRLPAAERAEVIRSISFLDAATVADVMQNALGDATPEVRAAGRDLLAVHEPSQALDIFEATLVDGQLLERRFALQQLARMEPDRAFEMVVGQLKLVAEGRSSHELELDILTSAKDSANLITIHGNDRKRRRAEIAPLLQQYREFSSQSLNNPVLVEYRSVLQGGAEARGRNIFLRNQNSQCVRCHRVDSQGASLVGPDLSDVGRRLSRLQIVESIVNPSAQIAQGYEAVTLMTVDGKTVSGIVTAKSNESITIRPLVATENEASGHQDGLAAAVDAAPITIPMKQIEEIVKSPKSAMPDDLHKTLTLIELRDLVEFLATRRTPSK